MPLQLARSGVRKKRALNKHQSKIIPDMVAAGKSAVEVAAHFNIDEATAAHYIKHLCKDVEVAVADPPDDAPDDEADDEAAKAKAAKAARAKTRRDKAAKGK